MKSLLITGAGGVVGAAIRPLLRDDHRLVLFDRRPIEGLTGQERGVVGDIGDGAALRAAMRGVDAVIHLAGCTTEAPFDDQVAGNVVGAWRLFEEARAAGVERVVFASTHHVVGHYPRSRRIGVEATLRPDSRYGLTKAFGEQVGAFFADQFGLRVFSIRIGFVGDAPTDRRRLSIWISPRDLVQLIRIGLEHPTLRHAIVYGVSDNPRGFFDNAQAYRLGYRPQDSAEDFARRIIDATPAEDASRIGAHVMGGSIAEGGFVGDVARIHDW